MVSEPHSLINQKTFFPSGGGTTGNLFRSIDWSKHSLGPTEFWPPMLQNMLSVLFLTKHPMFIFWGSDHVCFYNDAYLPSFGVSGKHPNAMGQMGIECFPEIWSAIKPQIDYVINESGATWNAEQLLPIYRNGRLEDVYWTYSYSPIVQNNCSVGVLVICTEVTDQVKARITASKNAEQVLIVREKTLQDLEASRDQLRGFFMQAPTPMVILEGTDYCFTLANPPYEKLIGRKAQGKKFADVFPAGEADAYLPLLDAVYKTGIPYIGKELSIDLADESGTVKKIWVDAGYYPFRKENGEIKGILAIVHDVTDSVLTRKAIEESTTDLKNERAKLAAIFYGTNSPMVLFRGSNLVYEMANPKYLEMIADRNVIGRPLTEVLPEKVNSQFLSVIKRVYETGEPAHLSEGFGAILNTDTGKIEDRFFDTTFSRVSEGRNEPYLVVGHAMDVSDRVRIQKSLASAIQEAEKATELKSAFLANMSHEIRTPLGAILGFADILKTSNMDAAARNQYLEIISRNGQSLTKIIDDILDLSKIEAGKLEIQSEPIYLAELARDVVAMFSDHAIGKGLILNFDDSAFPKFRINSDAVRIRQVLINLIGNAVKFTSSGSVTIHGDYEKILEGAVRVCLFVTDTGIGMTKTQSQKLFIPFMQGDNTNSRKFGGTGLGLALSRRLGRALGGDVSLVGCELEKGCTFKLEFVAIPTTISNVSESRQIPNSSYEANLLAGFKILVADDSPDNRKLMELKLQKEGAAVSLACDGEQAVQMARNHDYDVVLMDIQMPVLDGYQALAQLRKQNYRKPVIALTAHAMKEERNRAIAAGFGDNISKPVNMRELVNSLLTHGRPH